MTRVLFIIIFFVSLIPLNGQELHPYNKALIWRGMEHKWTYNHRVNRLGNYVTMQDTPKAIHLSATGLGSDSTFFTSHYTYVESPNAYFKEVSVSIQVNGKEGELLTKTQEVYIPIDPWMHDKQSYQALINGFEITSILKADQIQLFRFLVKEVEYSHESSEIKVKVDFNLVTNCRTIECPVFNNKTAYDLTIKLLIIAYDGDDVNLIDAYSSRNYVWDQKIQIENESQKVVTLGEKNGLFPVATVGIKGLGIILNEEHWLLEMNQYIIPNQYDAQSGILVSDANLKYVEWKKGMQQFAVAPFKAKFAKRRSGYALLDMNLAMIQFKQATIKQGKSSGTSFWGGWNQDASSHESKGIIDLSNFINK